MAKTLAVATLVLMCLASCQNPEAQKAAGLTILNVNDLNDQHKKDKEALRAKYNGKEVVVLGRATDDFDPEPIFWETGGKQRTLSLVADESKEVWVGVYCKVDRANEGKFAGIKKDAIIAVKGVLHVNGGMELNPCTREFRETK